VPISSVRTIALAFLAATVFACTSSPVVSSPDQSSSTGLLQVQRVESTATLTLPARVTLQVTGILADSCTQLGAVSQSREGSTVTVSIATSRQGSLCAQVTSSVTVQVPLDGSFSAGEYLAHVNATDYRFKI